MDKLEKLFNEMYDNAVKFVDTCLKGNKDFNTLDADTQVICKALASTILITYQWMDFCKKVNK